MLCCTPWSVHIDLAMTSFQNGTQDLPVLSRGYGALMDQAAPLDQASLSIQKT